MASAVVDHHPCEDGGVVVEVRGELALETERALRLYLEDLVSQTRPPRIVVDMLHVRFIDSTGIGALVAGYKAATSAGIGFQVRRVAPLVERQLKLTGLYELLTTASSR